ncbi:MAG TPA: proton-conducting transporter membrane subunit [Tepidisphaeraceae bacterium]|nr:proton-conducting transporter membrane subunit [Tepidisphaeraceae bacterium]
MDSLAHQLLSIVVFLPAIGGFLLWALRNSRVAKRIAIGFSAATFIIALLLPFAPRLGASEIHFDTVATMLLGHRISYRLGADGLSWPLVVVTALLFVLACVATGKETDRFRPFFSRLLLLESCSVGTFLARDPWLFFILLGLATFLLMFLERSGSGQKSDRAYGPIIHAIASGILLVVAIAMIDRHTALAPNLRALAFVLFVVAMLIRMAILPFGAWIGTAYSRTPAPILMVLSPLVLLSGAYGLLRIAYPTFSELAASAWLPLASLGTACLLFNALCALSQPDLHRFLAHQASAISGLILIGIAVMSRTALNGTIFLLVASALANASLVFIADMIRRRAGHANMDQLGGLAGAMPRLWSFSVISMANQVGLPALAMFVGEILIVIGIFRVSQPQSLPHSFATVETTAVFTIAVATCVGLILLAVSMARATQSVFLGPPGVLQERMPDARPNEITVLAPLAALIVALGILPSLLIFHFTGGTMREIMSTYQKSASNHTTQSLPEPGESRQLTAR